jgi:sn-glycerol 3-phosphate transport system permease protein
LLIAPQLLVIVIFFYWPSLQAVAWSLHLERPFGGQARFVGLANYTALFADDTFLRSLATTAIFTGVTTLVSVVGATALAVAVDRRLPGTRLAASWLIWPYAVAAPAAGVVIQLIADPRVGVLARLNDIWPAIWSPESTGWEALTLVIAAFAWLHVPFNFIFLLTGLQTLPRRYYEAAAVDGAGPWRLLADIQLPLMRPYLVFVLALDVAESFNQSFGVINATTHGGPGGATNVFVYNIYADGFLGMDLSRSAAESVLLAIAMTVIAAIQFHALERQRGFQ